MQHNATNLITPLTPLTRGIIFCLLIIHLVGCSVLETRIGTPPENTTTINPSPATFPLAHDVSASQTCLIEYDGLEAIDLFLQPHTAGDGRITISIQQQTDVANKAMQSDEMTTHVLLSTIDTARWYHLAFDSAATSLPAHTAATIVLELHGSGSVGVGYADGNSYLQGALSINDAPLDAQLMAHVAYNQRTALIGYAQFTGIWALFITLGIALLVVPGFALLTLLLPQMVLQSRSWHELVALAGGVGLAIAPLTLLWTHTIGVHAGALNAWGIVGISTIYLLVRYRLWRHIRRSRICRTATRHPRHRWHSIAFIGTLAIIILTRTIAVYGIEIPLWGDSYHHTMIATLIEQHGGLFTSWEPYAPLSTFTYHFGFHSQVAFLHWFTRLPITTSTVWMGQISNVLAILTLYPLARIISNETTHGWAGIATLLVAGLLAPQPMEYTNWGRYTQLTGQAILPVSIYLLWLALQQPTLTWRMVLLTGISLAGLLLTHYRVSLMALFFLPAYGVLSLSTIHRKLSVHDARGGIVPHLRRMVGRSMWIGSVAGILFLPWGVTLLAGKMATLVSRQIATRHQTTVSPDAPNLAIGDLSLYLPPILWILVALALGWALWRRKQRIVTIALWWFLLLLAANTQWLALSANRSISTFALNNFTIFIAAYIPAALIIGAAVGWLFIASTHCRWARRRIVPQTFWLLAVLSLAVWGGWHRIHNIVAEQYTLVTMPDQRAARWIDAHVPHDARFVVNSFFAYGGSVAVGSDAGWWLPLLAHRDTILPPITYRMEQARIANYRQQVDATIQAIATHKITDAAILEMVQQQGVTHIYIGQQQGTVNSPTSALLNPYELAANNAFHLIYHRDRVWIFEIVTS